MPHVSSWAAGFIGSHLSMRCRRRLARHRLDNSIRLAAAIKARNVAAHFTHPAYTWSGRHQDRAGMTESLE